MIVVFVFCVCAKAKKNYHPSSYNRSGLKVILYYATLLPFKFSSFFFSPFYCLLSLGRRFHLNNMTCYNPYSVCWLQTHIRTESATLRYSIVHGLYKHQPPRGFYLVSKRPYTNEQLSHKSSNRQKNSINRNRFSFVIFVLTQFIRVFFFFLFSHSISVHFFFRNNSKQQQINKFFSHKTQINECKT